MNIKQKGWAVEKRNPAVGANGTQTITGQQTQLSPTAPYSAVNVNSQKFAGIFRHGTDVALMEGAHEYKAKRMGS